MHFHEELLTKMLFPTVTKTPAIAPIVFVPLIASSQAVVGIDKTLIVFKSLAPDGRDS